MAPDNASAPRSLTMMAVVLRRSGPLVALGILAPFCCGASALAQPKPRSPQAKPPARPQSKPPARPQPKAPETEAPIPGVVVPKTNRADPKTVWPANLPKLAGKYVYVQVASPGGLWERTIPADGKPPTVTQRSINEIPAALRDRISKAEIVIGDLKTPGEVEAADRESPTKRGRLRFYRESAEGTLTLKNIPGIGAASDDTGDYTGKATFQLTHQSHSNPSPIGVQMVRDNEEFTWGAATVDYGDLQAVPIRTGDPEEDELPVIANARVLRSGLEIIAYIEWREKDDTGERLYQGSIRLRRTDAPAIQRDRPPQGPPAPRPLA